MSERIDLQVVLPPALPAAMVDPHQLESAILNLALNARDAMPDGGALTVETSVVDIGEADSAARPGLSPARYLVVAVSDTGVGMSPEIVEKVFDPFFTTKPIGQGTGLGLSMVYGFARQSGVLVREVLEELRYEAVEFADPLAALPFIAGSERIDLMISDVGLPGMNGRELAETARSHRPDLPILFITGYAKNAAIRSGFLGTRMAMITKPFSLDELANRVRHMLPSEIEPSDRTSCRSSSSENIAP